MTKKRLLLLASVPLAIVVTLGVLAMLPPRPGVTKANFDRIEEGMTVGEVEGIFGRGGEMWSRWAYWQADDGSWAVVEFSDNSVSYMQWLDSDETILNKIRRWLHLQ